MQWEIGEGVGGGPGSPHPPPNAFSTFPSHPGRGLLIEGPLRSVGGWPIGTLGRGWPTAGEGGGERAAPDGKGGGSVVSEGAAKCGE